MLQGLFALLEFLPKACSSKKSGLEDVLVMDKDVRASGELYEHKTQQHYIPRFYPREAN